jgi:hypothetical protein
MLGIKGGKIRKIVLQSLLLAPAEGSMSTTNARSTMISFRIPNLLKQVVEQHTKGERRKRSRALCIALQAGFQAENLDALKQRIASSERIQRELKALRTDLAKVGGNLNQLAYMFNLHDDLKDAQLRRLGDVHRDLQEQFGVIMNKLKVIERDL